jgi:hypothetical protein
MVEDKEKEDQDKDNNGGNSNRERDFDFTTATTSSGEYSTYSETDEGHSETNKADSDVLPILLKNLENITGLIESYFEQSRENKEVDNEWKKKKYRHRLWIVVISASTFLIVITLSAVMTIYNALSGDAFTFVLGTLFGSILTFLQNMISDQDPDDEG